MEPPRLHLAKTSDENNALVQLSKEGLRNERVGAYYWAVTSVILSSLGSLHLQSQSQNRGIYPTSIQGNLTDWPLCYE